MTHLLHLFFEIQNNHVGDSKKDKKYKRTYTFLSLVIFDVDNAKCNTI